MGGPRGGSDLCRKGQISGGAGRIMQREVTAQMVQAVRHGDHRGDTDATAHQHAEGGVFGQGEMVDRAGGENLAPLREDTVHQGAAAAALILALDGNHIARPVCGIAAHGILAQVFGRDHHIQMRPCLPQGQIGPVGIAQFIARDAVA